MLSMRHVVENTTKESVCTMSVKDDHRSGFFSQPTTNTCCVKFISNSLPRSSCVDGRHHDNERQSDVIFVQYFRREEKRVRALLPLELDFSEHVR